MSRTGHGRIFYLGVGSAGLLGLIDASECPPTYGSLFNDVRGFLGGGWEELGNKAGRHVTAADGKALCLPPHLRGDAGWPSAATTEVVELGVREGFLNQSVLSSLNAADLVVLIAIHGDGTGFGGGADEGAATPNLSLALEGLAAATKAGCTVRHLLVGLDEGSAAGSAAKFEATVCAAAPEGVRLSVRSSADLDASIGLMPGSSSLFAQQLALKLALNALTTGAHVRKGTIVRNRMVNVCLTNAKLFHRAVGIVADVAGCDEAVARRCVVRAIYGVDEGDKVDAAEARTVLEHVAAASPQRMLVPVAILLATKKGSVVDCVKLLKAQRVVRLALL
jgi:enoyl-CoA hydratase/carnithine racemase